MPQQYQRKAADNKDNNDHPQVIADGKTGGNAGAGKSGAESLGTEKKVDDERFGSKRPDGESE